MGRVVKRSPWDIIIKKQAPFAMMSFEIEFFPPAKVRWTISLPTRPISIKSQKWHSSLENGITFTNNGSNWPFH
jgi:hypothetical protein